MIDLSYPDLAERTVPLFPRGCGPITGQTALALLPEAGPPGELLDLPPGDEPKALRSPLQRASRRGRLGPRANLVEKEFEPSYWLRFGGPLAVPIGVADAVDDQALATFIGAEAATWRYILVHSSISFPGETRRPRLETAEVDVVLSDNQGSRAVAWSMLPVLASTPYEHRSALTIGPAIKLQGADFSFGSFRRETVRLGKDAFLLASGELTSEPTWSFCRTRTVPLVGSYRLVMVVRAPVDCPVTMNVVLAGSIRVGRFRKKTVVLEEGAPITPLELP